MRNRAHPFSFALFLFCLPLLSLAEAQSPFEQDAARAMLRKHCFDCHGNGQSEGNLKLDELLDQPSSEIVRQRWWKVLNNVRAGTMPPPSSSSRLDKGELKRLSDWIKLGAFGIDPENPDPGRTTLRRLNRREYANTIRDLLGIEFNADIVFPPDDTGYGFDNVGDALSLSPMVVEKYLSAAAQIVSRAIPTSNLERPVQKFSAADFKSETGSNGDNMRLNKSHTVERSFELDVVGDYLLDIVLKSGGSFESSPQRANLVCELDGQELFRGEYGWDESKKDPRAFRRKLSAGSHRLTVRVTPIPLPEKTPDPGVAELDIDSFSISGPDDPLHWKEPKGYAHVFTRKAAPTDASERKQYAREIFHSFGLRAFRRPVDEALVNKLIAIADEYCEQPNVSFESGISHAIIPMLASPRFLFRFEGVEGEAKNGFASIDEFALATRLSYFLWSTMPDRELFELAEKKLLRKQLDEQVDRMLNDRRSRALVQNFVGQWLRTRDVEKVSIDPLAVFGLQSEFDALLEKFRGRFGRRRPQPDTPVDPETEKVRARFAEIRTIRDSWDGQIRNAMMKETEMLFEHIAKENRDLVEMIDPGYSFLNEKLATYYGIPNVTGPEMRRVELPPDSIRGGILTHGTMLTVTSNPTRTSPVKRGLFILENVLGTPTPPAPPNVPALEDSSSKFAGREPTLKELLAAHRESALCSSCHSRMDPLGIALENFNALGVWRDKEKDTTIDASGELITGEKFKDFRDLRRIIATDRKEDFYRCVTQKMMIYALGRGIDYYDEHALDTIVDRLMSRGGKFRELVIGIVRSPAFQKQRVAEHPLNKVASNQP